MSGKYALIIGNTEYNDPGLAQLTAPGKDTEDFAYVLEDQNIGGFDDVKVLLNELSASVIEAIDEFFALKKPDDLLLLYFSGHGVRDEVGALYLAVKNTNRSRLRSTAVKSDFIRETMDQSRSKRQLIILDCCNSGAFAHGTKAVTGGSMGFASAFEGTGYGRVVLTASDSTQFAWEGEKVIGETENSLFTHFLIRGIKGDADRNRDGCIAVDELYDYTYEQIVNITPQQTPGKWSYKQQGEIVLRQMTRMENHEPASGVTPKPKREKISSKATNAKKIPFFLSWEGRTLLGAIWGIAVFVFLQLNFYHGQLSPMSLFVYLVMVGLAGLIAYPHRLTIVLLILGFFAAAFMLGGGREDWYYLLVSGTLYGLAAGALISRILYMFRVIK